MDHYMKFGNENIHLAAILVTIGIIITLVCIIAKVMQQSLNKDLSTEIKNQISKSKRRQERVKLPRGDPSDDTNSLTSKTSKTKKPVDAVDVAWKKVHGDVFRPPMFPNILSCAVGAGF